MFKNKVWDYVERPHKKVIDSKWIFKIKSDKGNPKYKARLVIRGFKDTNEYDLHDTYAPVASMPTVRMIFAIINKYNLDAVQMDVKTAFLNGIITEDIYMEIPEGINCPNERKANKVCKLKKALYGLKISSKRWNETFAQAVRKLGLTAHDSKPCLFIWRNRNKIAILLLYVDDMILASNDSRKMNEIKRTLQATFEMSDMGEPKLFLGMEISRNRKKCEMIIRQPRYTKKVLERFDMANSKPQPTPMVTRGNETKNPKIETSVINVPYREAIGSLLYLAGTTRLDITYAVNVLSRQQNNPTEEDWRCVKRIFRYLQGTRELGLKYTSELDDLILYTDASFADNPGSKSTGGYLMTLFGDPIAWRSKKQSFVAMSTHEAEFVAMSIGCMNVIGQYKLLEFVLCKNFYPIDIFCDNTAVIDTVKKENTMSLRHNVEKNADYVIESQKKNRVLVHWVNSEQQPADIYTKALNINKHNRFRDFILNNN